MAHYSHNGQKPKPLPERIRLDDGSTVTSLNSLSAEELGSMGFTGPFTEPSYNVNTQKLSWDGSQYQVTDMTSEEVETKESNDLADRIGYIDYKQFWSQFLGTKVYEKVRASSTQTLVGNTIFTEVVSIFSGAASGSVEVHRIEHILNVLLLHYEFTTEEVNELSGIMNDRLMNLRYPLPDSTYLSSHTYDAATDTILTS